LKRSDLHVGDKVEIELRQSRGKRIQGSIERILTNTEEHPHGILVKLSDGNIGRVKNNANTISDNEQNLITVKPSFNLKQKSIKILDNQIGITYEDLFSEYLSGAKIVEIQDPYIILDYQIRNLISFCTVVNHVAKEATIRLKTSSKRTDQQARQEANLAQLEQSISSAGLAISIDIDNSIHDRCILIDNAWRIVLGRGLDIYKKIDSFSLESQDQSLRKCKSTDIDYIWTGNEER